MTLAEFKEKMEKSLFGMTRTEALEKRVCVSCKVRVDLEKLNAIDLAEWKISALCPLCFEVITHPTPGRR